MFQQEPDSQLGQGHFQRVLTRVCCHLACDGGCCDIGPVTVESEQQPPLRLHDWLRRVQLPPQALDPAAALESVTMRPLVLQEFRPLPHNLECDLGRLYWQQQGVDAFGRNEVPFLINNDGRASEDTAATDLCAVPLCSRSAEADHRDRARRRHWALCAPFSRRLCDVVSEGGRGLLRALHLRCNRRLAANGGAVAGARHLQSARRTRRACCGRRAFRP